MPINLDSLCKEIQTERTAILFGAGSSFPSGAPTGQGLADSLAERFHLDAAGLNLVEVSTLIELKHSREKLISELRALLSKIKPTGGILNIPNYKWRDIFTTNYDKVIEKSYAKAGQQLSTISANYEFDKSYDDAQKLFSFTGASKKTRSTEIFLES
ncbi:hypothetical protein [Aminobacter sp. AP02]|uniref:hypothetical protein n=1 Tax=Aminobacter sp. AP02 TaxID=2135737 RepID=UPI000D6A8DFD|nr:hypothetical protein [Aminobacter sp. AP02]